MKLCKTCNNKKNTIEYHKNKNTLDGLASSCKECSKVYNSNYQKRKKQERNSYQKEYRANNSDKTKQWSKKYYAGNKESLAPTRKVWRQKNKALCAFYCSVRRARKLQATPNWADLNEIKQFYIRAEQLTKETGIIHSVDHFIPLVNELVCGLHVPANLQILTKSENSAKGNSFTPHS